MTEQATVDITEREQVAVASLAGEVDLASIDDLRARIVAAIREGAYGVVLDLRRVTFLDSSGLHLVFGLQRRLSRRGKRLAVVLPDDPAVRQIFALVGIGAVVELSESIGHALAYCREPTPP